MKTGCEVLKHIEEIDETRYESYLEFVKEAIEYKEKLNITAKKETHKNLKTKNQLQKSVKENVRLHDNTIKQKIYKEIRRK